MIALSPKVSLQSVSAHARELGGQRLSGGERRGITAASAWLAGGTGCLQHWVSSKTSGLTTAWFWTLLGQPPDLSLMGYARGRLPAGKSFVLLGPSPKVGGGMPFHHTAAFCLHGLDDDPSPRPLPVLQYRNYLCILHPDSPTRSPHLLTHSAEQTWRTTRLSEQPAFQEPGGIFLPLTRGEVPSERIPRAFWPLAVEVRHKHTPLSAHFLFLLEKVSPTRCGLQKILVPGLGQLFISFFS